MFSWNNTAKEKKQSGFEVETQAMNDGDIVYRDWMQHFSIDDMDISITMKQLPCKKISEEKYVIQDKIILEEKVRYLLKACQTMPYSRDNYKPKKIQISLSNGEMEKEDISTKQLEKNSLIVSMARWTLQDVYLPQKTKEEINSILAVMKYREVLFNEWEFKQTSRCLAFNFYGKSGTGKSMTAEAIAGELDRPYIRVNYAELESKYVGDTPKNIQKVFKTATEKNAVIIFDEADSFLGKRLIEINQSADYGVNITRSVMLLELEKFDGIIIFTTNLIDNYDEAFKRRLFSNIEFLLPDREARSFIWKLHISKNLPLAEDITAEVLAERYENVSGADIRDILFKSALRALVMSNEHVEIHLEDFDIAYETIMARYNSNFGLKVVKEEYITEEQYLSEEKN